jgi:hypothetical protein
MQLEQMLSPNAIFASQKAHASVTLLLLLFSATTNNKRHRKGANKFTCRIYSSNPEPVDQNGDLALKQSTIKLPCALIS